jgi:hypothetical protein
VLEYMGNCAVNANERVSAVLRSGWHVMRGHACMCCSFMSHHQPAFVAMMACDHNGNDGVTWSHVVGNGTSEIMEWWRGLACMHVPLLRS